MNYLQDIKIHRHALIHFVNNKKKSNLAFHKSTLHNL